MTGVFLLYWQKFYFWTMNHLKQRDWPRDFYPRWLFKRVGKLWNNSGTRTTRTKYFFR